jgi:hypothetical protein
VLLYLANSQSLTDVFHGLPLSFLNLSAQPPLTAATLTPHCGWRQLPYQTLMPRLRRLWRPRAKTHCKHRSGDVCLGSISSFPIRVRPRTVRYGLEVPAQNYVHLLPYVTQLAFCHHAAKNAMHLSPGHWALHLVLRDVARSNGLAAASPG